MRKSLMVFSLLLLGALLGAQTKPRQQQKAQAPSPAEQTVPQKDDLTAAREATDRFLSGLKIGELPEGKQLMLESQWITGAADRGQNFYVRPVFTEATTLFEKLFDTDVPGVQGYKRLLEMKAVSEAGTQLLTRYWMVAYRDRHAGGWKVLATGAEGTADFDKQIAFFAQRHPDLYEPELGHCEEYGHWLLLAGKIVQARETLASAATASAMVNYSMLGQRTDDDADIERLQAKALLSVIDAVVGN